MFRELRNVGYFNHMKGETYFSLQMKDSVKGSLYFFQLLQQFHTLPRIKENGIIINDET